jgi:hypothetical protein
MMMAAQQMKELVFEDGRRGTEEAIEADPTRDDERAAGSWVRSAQDLREE